MARGEILMVLPGHDEPITAKTDLTGYGSVRVGEKFIARRVLFGKTKGNGKWRVRVREVERIRRNYHIVHCDVIKDLTGATSAQHAMF